MFGNILILYWCCDLRPDIVLVLSYSSHCKMTQMSVSLSSNIYHCEILTSLSPGWYQPCVMFFTLTGLHLSLVKFILLLGPIGTETLSAAFFAGHNKSEALVVFFYTLE